MKFVGATSIQLHIDLLLESIMDFGELREFVHWYILEHDYKSALMSDMHLIVYPALIVAALLFGLFCKIKYSHRWLVNAKCACCNCAARVWRAKLYWMFCNHCQRIIALPKNIFLQADSSMMDKVQPDKENSFELNWFNVRKNKIKSHQRKHISLLNNDLNDISTIISQLPKELNLKESDVVKNFESKLRNDDNTQIEASFMKVKNEVEQMLKMDDDKKQSSHIKNMSHLPDGVSDLTKVHKKLLLEDLKRRIDLLNAEKILLEKMKQMKELEKSLLDVTANATRRDTSYSLNESFIENSSHSIRRRNTFFERTLNHCTMDPNILNKEINSRRNAATVRLVTLEDHLTELRDLQANEIALRASILNKIEDLRLEVRELHEKIEDDYDHFKMKKYSYIERQKKTPRKGNDSENSSLSESVGLVNDLSEICKVKNDLSMIAEENNAWEKTQSPHHTSLLNHFEQESKQTTTSDKLDTKASCAVKRKSTSSVGQRARIVKAIRSGRRPTSAKTMLNSTPQ